MFRKTILPVSEHYFRPAFWGNDRDFREVIENIENLWEGQSLSNAKTKETEKAFLVSIDLPGVSKDDLNIEIEDSKVKIEATRKDAFTNSETKLSRFVNIPKAVDQEQIKAHTQDGVLYLALPKQEKQVSKKIQWLDEKEENHSLWANLLDQEKTVENK